VAAAVAAMIWYHASRYRFPAVDWWRAVAVGLLGA
jgi:hypothetical protein